MVPVFKNVGKRCTAKNYCPVSLLSVVGKAFEKLVNNRIVDYLEQALSRDFQRMCGKMHTQILLGMRWCATSIFLFLKFYNFVKGIMRIHSILKNLHTSLIIFLKYL